MNRLAHLRKEKNILQIDLAKELNISQGTLSNWERGIHDIDQEYLKILANYFDVTIDYLLGVTDEKNLVHHVISSDVDGNEMLAVDIVKEALDSGLSQEQIKRIIQMGKAWIDAEEKNKP